MDARIDVSVSLIQIVNEERGLYGKSIVAFLPTSIFGCSPVLDEEDVRLGTPQEWRVQLVHYQQPKRPTSLYLSRIAELFSSAERSSGNFRLEKRTAPKPSSETCL